MKKIIAVLLLSVSSAFAGNIIVQSGAGTITGVTAGTNMTGGGTSGNVTLNLSNTIVSSVTFTTALVTGTTDFGTLTSSPTISPDASLGNMVQMVLASSITVNGPINPSNGEKVVFRITQDATGSRTATWATGAGNFSFGTDIASITLTTTANAVDYIGAIYNATKNRWHIVAVVHGF